VERTDGRIKASGSAKYAADLIAPGNAAWKLLRSPLAHAKIKNIDTKKQGSEGREAVITAGLSGRAVRDQA